MNLRISLKEVKEFLVAQINDPGVTVRTVYDEDYLRAYGKKLPAVWIGGQLGTPASGNQTGYSGIVRQHVTHEVAIRLMVKRYGAEGDPRDIEDEMDSLYLAVANAMLQFQGSRVAIPFTVARIRDGAPEESLICCDLVFRSEVVYQYPTSPPPAGPGDTP